MNRSLNQGQRRTSLSKLWSFRILAMLLGLAPFLVFETGLWVCGWSETRSSDDPFVSFSAIRPLFVLNEQGSEYQIDASRLGYFRPAKFPAHKGEQEYRIFCLGGSTVQGNPWGPETSFTTWLELSLRAAHPNRDWRVVNVGGISYASYRLLPILRELLAHQPDMFILYTGHNEFLEDRTYQHIRKYPTWLLRGYSVLAVSKCCQFMRGVLVRSNVLPSTAQQRTVLPQEVDAILDYRDGLAEYRRDDTRRDAIVLHYGANLRELIANAQAEGVATIVCNPACNLRDCPPFKSEMRDDLSPQDQHRLERVREELLKSGDASPAVRMQLLEEWTSVDDRNAAVLYELGQLSKLHGDWPRAKQLLTRAKDEDVCPLRILSSMNSVVIRTAAELQVPLVDIAELMAKASSDQIPGEDLFVDHVHPTIRGHQMIAEALLEQLDRMSIVKPVEGWKESQQRLYRAHLESLDAPYFARGKEHLEGLRRWTQGRAPKIRPASR